MKTDKLKKNLFWILAGVAPLLVFILALTVVFGVGESIDTRQKAIGSELTTVQGVKPKGTQAIKTMGVQKGVIDKQKKELWKANWEQQLALFTWPNSPLLEPLQKRYQKFGEKINEQNSEFEAFKAKNVYEAAYVELAAGLAPTRFDGGWQNVLRYVSDWTDRHPTQQQIWLALEDLWVQRAVLEPIKAVNTEAVAFAPVGDRSNKFQRDFQSRLWALTLSIPQDGPQANKVIKATLTNRTDRMQPLGNGKTMRLRIELAEGGSPVEYRIERDFLKADEKYPVPVVANLHGIPAGTDVREILSVEQVLDPLTVPIRRIEVIELGKSDARHAVAALKPPTKGVFTPMEAAAVAAPGGMPGMPLPGMPPTEVGPGSRGVPGPGMFGPGGAGAANAKSGVPTAVLDAYKDRYIDTTDQVRRMPVAIVLLVDQMYLQDALVAYSNSKLRFQVTQMHWRRFHGTVDNPEANPGTALPGVNNGEGEPVFTLGSSSGGAGIGGRAGPGSGPPIGSMPPPPMMPPMPPGGAFPGQPGGAFPGSPGGGQSAQVAEAQASSGLVELTIYGVVTLYEKYVEEGAATATPPVTPAAPAPLAPATTPMTTPAPAAPDATVAPMPPANAPMTTPATPAPAAPPATPPGPPQ